MGYERKTGIGSTNIPLGHIFAYFYRMSGWFYIDDIVRRNTILVTHES